MRTRRAFLLPRLAAIAAIFAMGACQRENKAEAPAGRPVEVVIVEPAALGASTVLTGDIQAQKEVSFAFRIGGRMIERPVNVGDQIKAGQLLAKLDPATEQNALAAAEARLAAARGQVATARATFDRQAHLMAQGFTTRPRYEEARQALNTAEAAQDNAEAEVETAADRLGFTRLQADIGGTVTARGAETGEVVQPGQMVVQVARQDGRDAVFDVPARLLHAAPGDPVVTVALADDPSVVTKGRVREVSPQADPVTRTFRVRVGLDDPPPAMRLGASVTGRLDLESTAVTIIPAGALTMSGRSPAVWVVDPATSTARLRPIDILRFDPGSVVVGEGLDPGDMIVTGGTQALHPGQRVSPLKDRAADQKNAAATPRFGFAKG